MPTYAYTCTVCGHSFDVHQSFDDAPLTVCPECSGRLRKVFPTVGVVFKGSGFYRTDARTSDKAAAATSSAGSTPSAAGTKPSAPASTAPAPAATAPAPAAKAASA